jgi:TRAP-type C4-dicarboxylate transport system substrate-binding protein
MSQLATRKVKANELDILKAAAREAGELQRKLMVETDARLLADYKANATIAVNEPDRAAMQAATASVVEKWKAKPFGAFVEQVVSAAKA